jgi:transposase
MQAITAIGFDIAKSVFQVHGVDAAGQVVIRRQLKRRQVLAFFEKLPSCLVGIEAGLWVRRSPGRHHQTAST